MSVQEFVMSSLEEDISRFDRVQEKNFDRRESLIDLAMEKAKQALEGLALIDTDAQTPLLDPKDVAARATLVKVAVDLTKMQEDSSARRARVKISQREQQNAENTGEIVTQILQKLGANVSVDTTAKPDFDPKDLQTAISEIDLEGMRPIKPTELYESPDQGIVRT